MYINDSMRLKTVRRNLNDVIIVIHVYQNYLTYLESISLQQVQKVLGHYPICMVVPNRYRAFYSKDYPSYRIESFPDRYFTSIDNYSELLLSTEFYQRFLAYEYILIYQLDAFVFSDRLSYFSSLGYDYIGAPLSRGTKYWNEIGARVGNGGFSLRRIDAMLRVLLEKDTILSEHPLKHAFLHYEDLFFGYCGTVGKLHIPDVATALDFSVEDDVSHAYRHLQEKLPFGCHGWYKDKYSVFKPVIEQYGYKLPENISDCDANRHRRNIVVEYLFQKMLQKGKRTKIQSIVKSILQKDKYAIWGFGKDGRCLWNLLMTAEIDVEVIFDVSADGFSNYMGIPICQPISRYLQQYKEKLILGSSANEKEMQFHLLYREGFQLSEFISYSSFKLYLVKKYYKG